MSLWLILGRDTANTVRAPGVSILSWNVVGKKSSVSRTDRGWGLPSSAFPHVASWVTLQSRRARERQPGVQLRPEVWVRFTLQCVDRTLGGGPALAQRVLGTQQGGTGGLGHIGLDICETTSVFFSVLGKQQLALELPSHNRAGHMTPSNLPEHTALWGQQRARGGPS